MLRRTDWPKHETFVNMINNIHWEQSQITYNINSSEYFELNDNRSRQITMQSK